MTNEKADLLQTLAAHRYFLRYTLRDLSDDQLGVRTTPSVLCLGGIVKHVTAAERGWANFIVDGPAALGGHDEEGIKAHHDQFQIGEGDTLQAVLGAYESAAQATDRLVSELPDLDVSQPLPEAPWFEPGARWTARRVLLHIIAETAQHAGHADIIREALDGAKTMG